jgi:hypothetical protein
MDRTNVEMWRVFRSLQERLILRAAEIVKCADRAPAVLCCQRANHAHLPPDLPHRLVRGSLSITPDEGAGHLAATRAGGPTDDLEAVAILNDDVTDAKLEREDELLSSGQLL